MTDFGVLQEGRARRGRRERVRRSRRRRRRLAVLVTVLALGAVTLLAFMPASTSGPLRVSSHPGVTRVAHPRPRPADLYGLAPAAIRVNAKLHGALRSGLLFDIRSGRVLWERHADQVLPIASLTKMMTAVVVAARARPQARVLITPEAVHFSGSGVGLLPLGHRVPLLALLYGLLLPSGNDAAIALAQHVAGSETRFVALMNHQARELRLSCTHFTSESGIVDQGNDSCAVDLARLAHAVLEQPLLARIVGTRNAVLPFPIKGGKLYLYNNNPLLLSGFPGADGVKTGYTVAAGRCLVATARRGRTWLGVVLLHSSDPPGQATQLLNLGFAAEAVGRPGAVGR